MDIIEQKQISRRFTRALSTYDQHAAAQQQISMHLIDMLRRHTGMSFKSILEIGCGSGGFTRILKSNCKINEWWINDLCSPCEELIDNLLAGKNYHFLSGNAETINYPLKGKTDLIASASAFQWMEDLRCFFMTLSELLVPEGILLFNTFTPDNLKEIRRLTGIGLPYATPEQLKRWIKEAGFNIVEEDIQQICLKFDSPLSVLRHLKYTGVTATGNSAIWTRQTQEKFSLQYRLLFSDENRYVTLTYSPHYILAVKQ